MNKENILFKTIKEKHLDGWVRYMYMDEDYIYFREKDFKTQIESICKLNKETLKSTVVKEINHQSIKGELIYPDKVYEKIEKKIILQLKEFITVIIN